MDLIREVVMWDNSASRWQRLVVTAGFCLICAGIVIGLFVVYQRHRQSIVTVPQSTINQASPVAKKIGVPVSAMPADKTMHLILYYDGYTNPAVGQHYVGLVEATLKSMQPFASVPNMQITVLTSSESQCHVYKSVKNILTCNKNLLNQVNNLHFAHFKLGVLSPLDFAPSATEARGKNSAFYVPTYQGVLTQKEIDTFVSLYFAHELGHSLGLRDEYARVRYGTTTEQMAASNAEAGNPAYTPAQPDCAPDKATAQKWWGAYLQANIAGVGLFAGCAGIPTAYYPVQNTVMSGDPTDATYGRVSEDYIRGVLECFYGQESNITYLAGEVFGGINTSCSTFEANYPNFWQS